MKNTTKIGVVLGISMAFFVAEIAVGFRTRSLALIADAFHYLNDIVAYGIAFAAAYLQDTGQQTIKYTFAFHRAELVGSFFNGVFLLALALSILLQAIERFVNIQHVDSPESILIVGCIGLALNICSALVVHDHHGHGHHHDTARVVPSDTILNNTADRSSKLLHANHNHTLQPPSEKHAHNLGLMGVMLHLIGDAINNVGVIISAVLIWKLNSPNRFYADPAVSMFISLVIFGSAIPMTVRAGRILLDAVPLHLDLAKIKADLITIPKVLSVHDLHVWHLSQSVIMASLHVCVPSDTTLRQWEDIEQTLQHCFSEYGVNHVTISPETQPNVILATATDLASPSPRPKGGCRLPSQDDFGCNFTDLKGRKPSV
ncbi:hypothetical protein M422DRAFT_64803 [Sphaerobolus stellatus SS14]|nr:hypothetical protein M422DRAFT_64803 [Sphaerobolus stellatus SS14]